MCHDKVPQVYESPHLQDLSWWQVVGHLPRMKHGWNTDERQDALSGILLTGRHPPALFEAKTEF